MTKITCPRGCLSLSSRIRPYTSHSRRRVTAASASMSTCALSSVGVRACAPGQTAPRARRTVACAASTDRSASDEVVSVADRLRRAAVATAAAAALVACAPNAALANAFDGDLSPTNGPFKSLPIGLTEPDEIFREDFSVRFAGFEMDHKYLVAALVLGQAVGFVGSAVGGNEARKKGEQVRFLNEKLLKVNAELRREMREAGIGPYTAPLAGNRFIEKSADSTDEADDETVSRVVQKLKSGKSFLKNGDDAAALADFQVALRDIECNPNSFNEGWKALRKAQRGMGAALERLGRFKEALLAMQTVLALSTEHSDHAGETDALGVIADIYADLDQLELAAEYYDKYFNSLQEEDSRNAVVAELEAKAKATGGLTVV